MPISNIPPAQVHQRDLARVRAAVASYIAVSPGSPPPQPLEELIDSEGEGITDLLTDLHHLADALGVPWGEDTAHRYYLAEAGCCAYCGSSPGEAISDGERASCGGYEARTGDSGPHTFVIDDIEQDRREQAGDSE
ncbi:hypothetical protein [Specibacter sp. NPDC078692]|uniref:hypothetical protein n=1 Tax=Specibacter sp. NPDC078692 TaxID=3155818 RepID=UPI00341D2345